MGHQIIQQPDGLYAIFSTVSDGWVYYDLTRTEVEQVFIEEAADLARRRVHDALASVDSGEGVYVRMTPTFGEADEIHKKNFAQQPDFSFRKAPQEDP